MTDAPAPLSATAGNGAGSGIEETPGEAGPTLGQLVVGVLDGTISRLARRPVRIRVGVSPGGLLRGGPDVVILELRQLAITRLLVDRLLIRIERPHIRPGLPPRLRATNVGLKAEVSQRAVDRWVRATRLPTRLRITPNGIVATTSVRGIVLSEVTVELATTGHLLRLVPRRAELFGMEARIVPPLPAYLPLPPLPLGARLSKVEPSDGLLTVWLDGGAIDEPITPEIGRRLRRRLLPI